MSSATSDEFLSALQIGELQVLGRLVDASNATLFGEIRGSHQKFRVIYKPVAGERPLWDFPTGTLAARERAAYLVSKNGSFNLVPETVLREGPFGWGAVQRWIEVDAELDLIAFGQSDDPRLRMMALFDAITNNTDRKFGHILLASDGSVFGCDHGVTFHHEDKLRTVLWQFAGQEFTDLEHATLSTFPTLLHPVMAELEELLSEIEISALFERIERLIEAGTFPLPSSQWPAVPWPPV